MMNEADDLVKIIKQRMKSEGLRQKDLYNMTYISEAAISRWFNGYQNPKLDLLKITANTLGMRVALIDNLTGEEVLLNEEDE